MDFVIITNGEQQYEVDIEEDDNCLLVSTVSSAFGEPICGLSYINETTGNERVLRCSGDKIYPPKGGWIDRLYKRICPIKTELEVEQSINIPKAEQLLLTKVESADIVTLSKGQLMKKCETSGVARAALFQWNKLNTTIRRFVHSSKFSGSGGMAKCSGTSLEEAVTNRTLRDKIVGFPEVKALFGIFTLSDSEKVVLDASVAAHHICYVINDMKRKENFDSNQVEQNEAPNPVHEVQRNDTPELSNQISQNTSERKRETTSNSSSSSKSTPKKRKIIGATGQLRTKVSKKNRGSLEDPETCHDLSAVRSPMSCYEIKRSENITKNRLLLDELEL